MPLTVLNNMENRETDYLSMNSDPLAKRWLINKMEAAGYRFVGKHSAVKICHWTRQDIRGKNHCYKHRFYGIESHQCLQMTPAVFVCNFNCKWCWRQHRYTLPPKGFSGWDNSEFVLDSCIKEQRKLLEGFWGSEKAEKAKVRASMKPTQVAISLAGEPTLYPQLPELVDEILSRKMTAYLVTNGMQPDMVKKLLDHQPTNLYVTVYAADEKTYKEQCLPREKDYWSRVNKSLSLLRRFDCNTVIRLTLAKGLNMKDARGYAKIIESAEPKFVECKGFMAVSGARSRIGPAGMPIHEEIRDFAGTIEQHTSYRISDEKRESAVVLLTR